MISFRLRSLTDSKSVSGSLKNHCTYEASTYPHPKKQGIIPINTEQPWRSRAAHHAFFNRNVLESEEIPQGSRATNYQGPQPHKRTLFFRSPKHPRSISLTRWSKLPPCEAAAARSKVRSTNTTDASRRVVLALQTPPGPAPPSLVPELVVLAPTSPKPGGAGRSSATRLMSSALARSKADGDER